jgi:hypothetical protein
MSHRTHLTAIHVLDTGFTLCCSVRQRSLEIQASLRQSINAIQAKISAGDIGDRIRIKTGSSRW